VVDGKGYSYVKHWLPHDARAKTLATGSSIIEQALGHWGAGKVAITPQLSVADGLQAGRWLLQQPMRMHTRCGEGIEALRQYHYEYDEDTKAFSIKPEHDWSSHTADAFRYLACVVKYSEAVTRPSRSRRSRRLAPPTGRGVWISYSRMRRRIGEGDGYDCWIPLDRALGLRRRLALAAGRLAGVGLAREQTTSSRAPERR
jgi:hypothetical protein